MSTHSLNRRSVLAGIGSALTLTATTAAVVSTTVQPAAGDAIGDLIDANIETPLERVHRLVAELQSAALEVYNLDEFRVMLPNDNHRSLFICGFPPPPPPQQFEGPGLYETRIGKMQPRWWVEHSPRKPGYYRCRHVFNGRPMGQWRHFPVADVKFVAKLEV